MSDDFSTRDEQCPAVCRTNNSDCCVLATNHEFCHVGLQTVWPQTPEEEAESTKQRLRAKKHINRQEEPSFGKTRKRSPQPPGSDFK